LETSGKLGTLRKNAAIIHARADRGKQRAPSQLNARVELPRAALVLLLASASIKITSKTHNQELSWRATRFHP